MRDLPRGPGILPRFPLRAFCELIEDYFGWIALADARDVRALERRRGSSGRVDRLLEASDREIAQPRSYKVARRTLLESPQVELTLARA